MKKKNILFLIPPSSHKLIMERDKAVSDTFGTFFPIGLLWVASFFKRNRNHEANIRIVDCSLGDWNRERFEAMLYEYKPDLLGMTAFTPMVLDLKASLETAKRLLPDCITVIGGAHVASFKEQALCYDQLDYAIAGYGERAFLDLFDSLFMQGSHCEVSGLIYRDNGKIKSNPIVKEDIDSIPHPDYSLIPYRQYRSPVGTQDIMISTISSRGCPFKCTFCNSPDKIYRKRSITHIMDEIEDICSLGVKEIFFFDDLFNLNNERVYELCSNLEKEKINITWAFKSRVNNIDDEFIKRVKACGCERVHFGLETNDNESLKALKKGITVAQIRKAVSTCFKFKVNSVGSFMINLPGDTCQSIYERFKFANSLKLDYCQFAIMVAYNHSEIFDQGVKTGQWNPDLWTDYIRNPTADFTPPIWDNGITREDLDQMLREGLKKFHFRPQYIYQRLRNLHSIGEIKKYVKGGIMLLKL